jgi:hypothetical protein
LIGLVGAPNKGKSTLFSALTMNDVLIADYPFTTIDPNLGIAYATKKCVHMEFGVQCRPRHAMCIDGIRHFPINVIDVAGLVEGAHEGKGMGNQFLNDLAESEALIIVVDASGKTDANGNATLDADSVDDVRIIRNELIEWLFQVIKKHMHTISRAADGIAALHDVLAGLKVSPDGIEKVMAKLALPSGRINWDDSTTRRFASELLDVSKPYIIAANKSDVEGSEGHISRLKSTFGEEKVISCSAAIELALRKAAKSGVIDYVPGSKTLKIKKEGMDKDKANAIAYMEKFLKHHGTNVQELINRATFGLLDNIVVYPVEDESKLTDSVENVLPDALLIRRGSTAQDLAMRIHTDIGKNMLYAVDARSKKRLSKTYVLKDDDVIKIVSAAK